MTGTCILRGDPHIKTWDADKPDKHEYGPLGDYWLVKNKYWQIQARYKSNRNDNRAQIMGIAISGAMLGPEPYPVLHIPLSKDGKVTEYISGWGDDKILCLKDCEVVSNSFTKPGYYTLTYGDGIHIGRYFDNVNVKRGDSYTLNFFAPKAAAGSQIVVASITINQGSSQAVKITAEEWLLHEVGGQCGNYNGDLSDDYGNTIDDLVVNNNLFPTTNDQTGDVVAALDCDQTTYDELLMKCRNEHHATTNDDVILNCVLDCCGGGGPCELDGDS